MPHALGRKDPRGCAFNFLELTKHMAVGANEVLPKLWKLTMKCCHICIWSLAFTILKTHHSMEDGDLTMANRVHKISSIVGGMLFVADNLYIHTAWHLATAIGVSTCNMLLEQCFRSNAKEIDFIKVTPKTTTMALLMEKASLYCTKWRQ
ncbi:uncharacterized protein LOC107647656 isoform X2 [Arachis ipaensis]|uniref:uncharacterized protein LOC107647656 isoform X2 n=1 Tax=Arachis ipaensis TaxID=130454 RepID=UPI000A2B3BCF|nr:uncharacterized protein LOC107647656 isoform X2 [Arachis ipaensis]XP_020974225.1 uncharacterized protein LOC107647656 isoform X2 [Arachis ipaensis]XP_020974229.1 uncharacterized protein LOC107647656 isoform X2 [Arachis ipaensis]